MEDDKGEEYDEVADIGVVKQSEALEEKEHEEDADDDELDRSGNDDQTRKYANRLIEMPRSQPIGYYLKHEINNKTVKDLVKNHKYNDALLKTRIGKMDSETYKSLPIGPMYDAILKKKLAMKKERKRRQFRDIMDERCVGRCSQFCASRDFVILDIKEDEYMSLILRTPFLTTARADIRSSKGSMTLRAGKFKVRFIRTLRFSRKGKRIT
nr:hypothetical protein [Tanacetum cinerariifolium]